MSSRWKTASSARARLLTFDASALGSGHAMFDGSAETDGRFAFLGGGGNDFFFGGAGNDRFSGGMGAPTA